jgi:hypothetical protein
MNQKNEDRDDHNNFTSDNDMIIVGGEETTIVDDDPVPLDTTTMNPCDVSDVEMRLSSLVAASRFVSLLL